MKKTRFSAFVITIVGALSATGATLCVDAITRLPVPCSAGGGAPSGPVTLCNGSNSATAPTCPGIPAPTSYGNSTTGYLSGTFVAGATSTGSLTLNIAGLGAKTVYINGSAASSSNTVTSGTSYPFYYDGTYIQVAGVFPKTVAVFNANAQTGSLTIPLLTSPPTGDYSLSVYYVPTVGDVAAILIAGVTFADESGPQNIGFFNDGPGLAAGDADYSIVNVHAVAGTPLELIVTIAAQTTLQYSVNVNLIRNQ